MNSSDRHLGQTCSIMLHVEASLPAWPLPKCTMTLYPVTTANWTETSAVWWLDQRFCSDSRFFFAKNRNKSNLMIGPWRGISYPSFFFFFPSLTHSGKPHSKMLVNTGWPRPISQQYWCPPDVRSQNSLGQRVFQGHRIFFSALLHFVFDPNFITNWGNGAFQCIRLNICRVLNQSLNTTHHSKLSRRSIKTHTHTALLQIWSREFSATSKHWAKYGKSCV